MKLKLRKPAPRKRFVLLHGWGISHSVWQDFSRNTAHDVWSPCLYELASGQSACFLAMANALSRHLRQDDVVIAWSMGGQLALSLATISHKVSAIVFIASTPVFTNRAGWQHGIECDEITRLQKRLKSNPQAALNAFPKWIAGGDPKTLASLQQGSVEVGHVATLSCWLRQLKTNDLRSAFAALQLPVCVILGSHDVLIKPSVADQLLALNQTIKCHVIDDCGHTPFISHQSQTQTIIEQFLYA